MGQIPEHFIDGAILLSKGGSVQMGVKVLIMKDKKLYFQVKRPYKLLEKVSHRVPEVRVTFEPEKLGLNKLKLGDLYSKNPILRTTLEDVRTSYMMSGLNRDGQIEELSSRFNSLLNGISRGGYS